MKKAIFIMVITLVLLMSIFSSISVYAEGSEDWVTIAGGSTALAINETSDGVQFSGNTYDTAVYNINPFNVNDISVELKLDSLPGYNDGAANGKPQVSGFMLGVGFLNIPTRLGYGNKAVWDGFGVYMYIKSPQLINVNVIANKDGSWTSAASQDVSVNAADGDTLNVNLKRVNGENKIYVNNTEIVGDYSSITSDLFTDNNAYISIADNVANEIKNITFTVTKINGMSTVQDPNIPANVSQGKTATASSSNSGFEALKAVDGDEATFWCASNGNFPQWLEVDLGKTYSLSRIEQIFYTNDPWKYQIEGSTDNSNWTVLVDKTGNDVQGPGFTDNVAGNARYVKLTVYGGWGNWATSKEFKVYATTNNDASITSRQYSVNGQALTVSNVPDGERFSTFMSNIFPADGATIKLYEKDGVTEVTDGDIEDGMKVIGTAENKVNKKTYTVKLIPVLVSQGKTATASSTNPGFEASMAVDGDESSFWCVSSGDFPQWLEVDLGKTYSLSKIEQVFATNDPWKYKIEGSTDNSNWTVLVDKTGNTVQGPNFSDDVTGSARYVKLTIYSGWGNWASSKSFNVFAVLRSGASVSSTNYNIDSKSMTISNVPENETLNDFASNLTISNGAALKVYEKDGTTEVTNGNVGKGMKVEITSENGKNSAIYTIYIANQVYYVSSSDGDDENQGISSGQPWKSLAKMSNNLFFPGDQILLKAGDTWTGESLTLNGEGTAIKPILLSSYGNGKKPVISPETMDSNSIYGLNVAGWKIANLELRNSKDGIHLDYIEDYNNDYMWIENIDIYDMDDTYNSNPTKYNHISSGISINGWGPAGNEYDVLRNLTVKNITMDNVNAGWWAGAPFSKSDPNTGFTTGGFGYTNGVTIENVKVTNASQWGYAFSFLRNAAITNCDTDNTGFGVNPYGAGAIVVAYSNDVVIDGSDIRNARRGAQQYDGVGFDFEGGGQNTRNITYKNAIIDHTDGAGIMVFDNNGSGVTTNAVVDNVTITNFGENPGATSNYAGIHFYGLSGNGTGVIRNVTIDNSGSHQPHILASSSIEGFSFENVSYLPYNASGTFVKLDDFSKGDWNNRYGYDSTWMAGMEDIPQPSYADVDIEKNYSHIVWSETTNDKRGLINLSDKTRSAKAITTSAYGTITINIDIKDENKAHIVDLYMIDWDNKGRRQLISIESPNGDMMAQKEINSFNGGIYYSFKVYGGPIKLKINDKAGKGAVLSGLFFGPAKQPMAADFKAEKTSIKPVLDGAINQDEWNASEEYVLDYENNVDKGSGTSIFNARNSGTYGKFKILWDTDGLYIAGEVNDNSYYSPLEPGQPLNNNDCIQVVFEPLNKKSTGVSDAYIFDFVPATKVDKSGPAAWFEHWQWNGMDSSAGVEVAGKLNDTGYTVETFIPWKALMKKGEVLSPVEGAELGFGLMIGNFNSKGSPVDILTNFGYGNNKIGDASAYNNLVLSIPTPPSNTTGTITGTVKDNSNNPISVDSNGNVSINVSSKLDSISGTASSTINSDTLTNAFNSIKESRDGEKKLELNIPKVDGAKAYEPTLPASFLSSGDAKKTVEIKTDIATVTVPGNMLSAANAVGKQNISLTVAVGDKSKLTEDTQEKIGSKPVIELNLKIDGKPVSWSNDSAPVVVSIPYTIAPDELKDPEHITIWYIDGSGNVVSVPSGRYDPATGNVTFSTTHFSKYAVAFVQKTFVDINYYSWAKKQIEVLASKGIINGTSTDTFSPTTNITRADYVVMLVKVLELSAEFDSNFDDVKLGTYYYEAVGIAKKLGIAIGSDNKKFNPKENISRQDMMVMTARALKKLKKLEVAGSANILDKFKDKADIAGYAVDSLVALVKEGLITGSGDKMTPFAKTTRAEAAVFLYRIYNK